MNDFMYYTIQVLQTQYLFCKNMKLVRKLFEKQKAFIKRTLTDPTSNWKMNENNLSFFLPHPNEIWIVNIGNKFFLKLLSLCLWRLLFWFWFIHPTKSFITKALKWILSYVFLDQNIFVIKLDLFEIVLLCSQIWVLLSHSLVWTLASLVSLPPGLHVESLWIAQHCLLLHLYQQDFRRPIQLFCSREMRLLITARILGKKKLIGFSESFG